MGLATSASATPAARPKATPQALRIIQVLTLGFCAASAEIYLGYAASADIYLGYAASAEMHTGADSRVLRRKR